MDGFFEINGLPPDKITVVFSMMGYEKQSVTNIEIVPGIIKNLDIKLNSDILNQPEVIVTSTRKAQNIMESPVSVSIIGRRDLSEKGALSLEEALPYVAGVSTVNGQLSIRGASGYTMGAGSRSLVLLDGVPLLGGAAGNVSWNVVPTSEISQIEVVKSGGGALYGSSAMGGVINILTRVASPKPEWNFSTQLGVFSQPAYEQWQWRDSPSLTRDFSISHSRKIGNHSAWLRLKSYHSDGYTEMNWEDVVHLSGKIKFNFRNRHTASFFINALNETAGLIGTWKSQASPFEAVTGTEKNQITGTKLFSHIDYQFISSEDSRYSVKSGLYLIDWENNSLAQDFSHETKYFLETQNNTTLFKSTDLISGISLQKAIIDAKIFGLHHQEQVAAYAQVQKKLASISTLTTGARYETYYVDNDVQSGIFSPSLAINIMPAQWFSWRASYGKGFRVPTVAEMFANSTLSIFQVEPNPNLRPEISTMGETGFTLKAANLGLIDGLQLNSAIFQTDFIDMIEPKPDGNGTIHFENVENARIRGYETSLQASFLNHLLELSQNYTYLDPVKLDENNVVLDTLSYRYRHSATTSLGARFLNIHLLSEYRYASALESVEIYQENIKTGEDKQVPIHVWNFALSTQVKDWNVQFRVNNAFQYYYTTLERNINADRHFTLSIGGTIR